MDYYLRPFSFLNCTRIVEGIFLRCSKANLKNSKNFNTVFFFFQTPCCNKVYTCRFCHDKEETHTVNRKEVTELICVLCDTRQPVQATCQNCHCRFGKYTCLECNLFDDEDKNQYHCDGCGICRVGGRDRFFHCAKCNMCLPVQLQNGHTVSNALRDI